MALPLVIDWLRLRMLRSLRATGASTAGGFPEPHFQTTQKTRIIARPRHQQIVRLDRENHGEIRQGLLRRIHQFVARQVNRYDGIVVSDYGKGVIYPELLDWIADWVKKRGRPWVVDPKKENFRFYRNPTLVTPNKQEASEASGIEIEDESSLQEAGRRLLVMWQAKAVLITRGPDGMSLFRPGREVGHFSTEPREIFDVTGAGDELLTADEISRVRAAETAHPDPTTTGTLGKPTFGFVSPSPDDTVTPVSSKGVLDSNANQSIVIIPTRD